MHFIPRLTVQICLWLISPINCQFTGIVFVPRAFSLPRPAGGRGREKALGTRMCSNYYKPLINQVCGM